ncbi:MAG: 30S ribosomal protein S5 [archaeon]
MAEEKKDEKAPEEEVEVIEEATPITAAPEDIEVIESGDEEHEEREAARKARIDALDWTPKTALGTDVKNGKIRSLSEILDRGTKILEAEIVDALLPDMEIDLLLVGQSKGKFGGGQRRIFKQTQKKTREGNKPKFMTFAVVGNQDGYIGVGGGKSKETVPAREKAIRRAKLNIIKIRRGTGSWEDNSKEPHSIPFAVSGKCGSCEIKLMPAPKGKGLCIEPECQKLLTLAGIQNIWSRTRGKTKTKTNLLNACFAALKKLSTTKVLPDDRKKMNIVDGSTMENFAEEIGGAEDEQ